MLKPFLFVFSFLCVALGQPTFFSWLGPCAATFGIGLFWSSLEGIPLSKIGKISFLWFSLVQMVQTSWMVNLEYQGLYVLVLYLLICIGIAWQFSFLTKMAHKNLRFDAVFVIFLASLWTLLEWVRLQIFCGFSFNFLGVFLSCYPSSLQMASLFGVLGMSFWVVLTNLAAWQFFRNPLCLSGIRFAILAILPYLYGIVHMAYYDHKFLSSGKGFLSVLLVQPGLTPSEKYSLKGREMDFIPPIKQWEKILQSVSSVKKPLDLIALPEAVVPFGLDLYIYNKEEIYSIFYECLGEGVKDFFPPVKPPFGVVHRVSNAYILQTLSNFYEASVLAGLDFQTDGGQLHNSAFYFQPGSFYPLRYDKRILLPLAEYMPFSFLTRLSSYYGIEQFFTAGKQAAIFPGPLCISPCICYEELFPSLVRDGRKKGGELLVSLSNDGWYPSSNLPMQHFTHGLIRSVENGIPLIRSCNTGVTAAIDGLGRVVGKLTNENGEFEKVSGCFQVQVPKNQHVTGFALWGDGPLIGSCFLSVIFTYLNIFLNRKLELINIKNIINLYF